MCETTAEPTRPSQPPKPSRGPVIARAVVIALLATTALILGACSDKSPPVEEKRMLVIDGIEILFEDLRPYVEFIESYRPAVGEKTKNVWVMRDHVLPMFAARRAFGEERAVMLERANALCSVATNILELEQHSKLIEHKRRSNMTRINAKLPVAMFLFDELMTNAVSPPIELPQGYFVVGSYDLNISPLTIADFVDALQVGFVTHTSKDWRVWWESEQLRIGAKVTFVHRDYRDDLPPWMTVPKDKKP